MAEKTLKAKKDSFFGLHFTSIVSISLVLFMVGMISIIISSARLLSIDMRENMSMSVILSDDISEDDLSRLNNYLNSAYFTREIRYISKDSALVEHCAAVGSDPSELLGFNPLNASIEVYLKSEYAQVDSINNVVKPKVSSFTGINEIVYQEGLVDLFNDNMHKASMLIGLVAIVLLFISIVLINNTIRLTIYSKRFIVNTMLLVGAKKSFIRAPFLKRAVINGLISAVVALLFLVLGVYYTQSKIGSSLQLMEIEVLVPTVILVLSLGLLITLFASIFSVNKYINMKTNKLYFV